MIDIDMRQLSYFLESAETGSFSRAAKSLFVSPQAVSKGVQILEGRLGTPLFDRSNGLHLTEFGAAVRDEARSVFLGLDRIEQIALRYREGDQRVVAVGINPLCLKTHGGTLDVDSLRDAQSALPEIKWKFVEMKGDLLIDEVMRGTLEFGISGSTPPNGAEKTVLSLYPMAAVVSASLARFRSQASATLRDLAECGALSLPGEEAILASLLDQAPALEPSLRLSPLQIELESDTSAIARGDVFAIRPLQHAQRTIRDEGVLVVPLAHEDGTPVVMPLHLFWRSRELTEAESRFVKHIEDLYRDRSADGEGARYRRPGFTKPLS
ncbi:LysR family transcriptional regulator [Rubneribacter sp.]